MIETQKKISEAIHEAGRIKWERNKKIKHPTGKECKKIERV